LSSEETLLRRADKKKKSRKRKRGPYRKSWRANVSPSQSGG